MTTWTFSMKRKQDDFWNREHGINHKIELKDGFQPKSYNLMPEEQKKMDKFIRTIWTKGISDHLNLPWLRQPSSSRKNMVAFDLAKITDTSTIGQLKTLIHSPLYRSSWTKSKTPNTLRNLTFVGDTIMFKLKMATNGKQPSKRTKNYLSQPSCSLASVTRRPRFKRWWMIYFQTLWTKTLS
jgi:hypothetical protein